MAFDESKYILTEKDYTEAEKAFEASSEEFLEPSHQQSNVVGLAVGTKFRKGEPTGEPALMVLVANKLDKSQLSASDVVPSKLNGMPTDVLEVGYLMAGAPSAADVAARRQYNGSGVPTPAGYYIENPVEAAERYGFAAGYAAGTDQYVAERFMTDAQKLAKRVRPAKGGYSVGHKNITAGTIATCVYDIQPGGSINPAQPGIGIPNKYYILSNNHVLANSNNAKIGDPILQPGPFDGGVDPADRIATLSRFIPIDFEPMIPRARHRNLVDAAIAEGQFHDLDREIFWTGNVRGWRRKSMVKVGTLVQKTGRTTNYTIGRITAVNAIVDVNFGAGRVARFRDQIVTTNMSAGGDSGSLLTTLDEVAVGLLFAGSSVATIHNQIENVRALLKVEIAEQIL